MKLWMKILIAITLGAIAGHSLGEHAVILKPVGDIFLSLINMIIVLLIFSSMTVGITSIHDPQKLGRIGIKTFLLYMATTTISIIAGLLFAKIFHLGSDLDFQTISTSTPVPPQVQGIGEILLSIVPSNPIASLVQGNVLQIIVFSIFLGIAINMAGEKGKPLLTCLKSLMDVMYKLTSMIMAFSPIGVFAIMAWVTGSFGLEVLFPLMKFLFAYYFTCLLHLVFVFGGILWMARLNPLPFFRGMRDASMMAFSTCSSSATLPVSMHCVEKNLGVSKNITSFVLPLGSTVNMNGAAIFQGMSVVFVANAYGIDLDMKSLLTIVVTGTLSAIGAAGVPGSGFMMLSIVFSSVGLPIQGLGLLAGIDRLREMISTVLNVLGDAVCAVYVAKQEGELDERQYNDDAVVILETTEN